MNNRYSLIRNGEDEVEEDLPLLSSSSTGVVSKQKKITRTLHRTYAKKLKNERVTRGTFLSQELSDCDWNGPIVHRPPSSIFSVISLHGCCCVHCVRTKEVGILEKFGEFYRIAEPGLSCMPWPCIRVAGKKSLRVQQLDVTFEGKTKDNVFVTIKLAILYQIKIEDVKRAFYTLTDPEEQLRAHAYDIVRSVIPLINIDDLFVSTKYELDASVDILRGLQRMFSQRNTGYDILNVLIMEIAPHENVRDAMNEINACKRWKEATAHKAESDKFQAIKMAEAESQASYLLGVGTAKERNAIAKGMQETLVHIEDVIKEKNGNYKDFLNAEDAMFILLMLQYSDLLIHINSASISSQKSIILHHG